MRYVYLVRAGESQYKVGVASNILKRVKALRTSNANLIEVVAAKQTVDALSLEKQIHRSLNDRQMNGGSEWFGLSPEVAIEVAITINSSPGISISEVELLYKMIEEQNLRQHNMTGKMQSLLEQVKAERPPTKTKSNDNSHKPTREQKEKLRKSKLEESDEKIYIEAILLCTEHGSASTSFLQRKLRIGYGKAARIMDRFEDEGRVGEVDGARPRMFIVA